MIQPGRDGGGTGGGLVRDLADYDARFGVDFDTTSNAGLDAEAAV